MTNTAPKSTRAQHITSTGPMLDGRRNDSMRRRQRVIAVLDCAAATGEQISTSAIARAAGVDRTFLYRHRDLLEKIHALQADPATSTDIDALHQRINQLEQHNLDLRQQLDERDDDLAAARATNRELMAQLNTTPRTR